MIRRPPRSTPLYSSAASDVYKRQVWERSTKPSSPEYRSHCITRTLSLIHISEPMRHPRISYAAFCLKKKHKITSTRSTITPLKDEHPSNRNTNPRAHRKDKNQNSHPYSPTRISAQSCT